MAALVDGKLTEAGVVELGVPQMPAALAQLESLRSARPAVPCSLSARVDLQFSLEQLIGRIDKERSTPSVDRLRIMRAVEIVEMIGNHPARALLETTGKLGVQSDFLLDESSRNSGRHRDGAHRVATAILSRRPARANIDTG